MAIATETDNGREGTLAESKRAQPPARSAHHGGMLDSVSQLPALRLVQPPRRSRRLANILTVFLICTPFALAMIPWRQTVSGMGKVVALDPTYRPQVIEAPVSGRIMNWWVEEGSRVKAGDRLVEILDNDPNYVQRLEDQHRAISTKLKAYEEKIKLNEIQVQLLQQARDLSVNSAKALLDVAQEKVLQAEQNLRAAQASLERDTYQEKRIRQLATEGLASSRDLEVAERDFKSSQALVGADQKELEAAKKNRDSKKADLDRIIPAENAKIQDALAYLQASVAEVETTRKDLSDLDVRIERQKTQMIYSPKPGTVFRILANQTLTGQVREGDPLIHFVPDSPNDVTEIFVYGNDMPLIHKGDPVRLQFEGWPAIQFVGWPSVAVGTFGGRVLMVDQTDDGKGKFRILVEPDPDDAPWPSSKYLRQGVKAKGFVLLREVRLGYEMWRRLNGFPPVISDSEPDDDDDGDSKKSGKIKIKRPK
jgi:multidrug efflux pump subunit AcrA (membrane-fusion protein)